AMGRHRTRKDGLCHDVAFVLRGNPLGSLPTSSLALRLLLRFLRLRRWFLPLGDGAKALLHLLLMLGTPAEGILQPTPLLLLHQVGDLLSDAAAAALVVDVVLQQFDVEVDVLTKVV